VTLPDTLSPRDQIPVENVMVAVAASVFALQLITLSLSFISVVGHWLAPVNDFKVVLASRRLSL
jgi:hypothetical protein